jgi:general secretion pathway protein D
MIFRPNIFLMALLVSACATAQVSDPAAASVVQPTQTAVPAVASSGPAAAAMPSLDPGSTSGPADRTAPATEKGTSTKSQDKRPPVGSRLFPGNDTLFKSDVSPKVDPALASGDRVSLNFENINVASLASALLGDLLQLNYTIDAGGDTVVSLHTRQPLPRSQVLDVLDTVLLPHDLAIVRDSAGVYHVTKRTVTVGSRPVVGTARFKDLAGAGTVIVPLNHIGASEMAKILAPVAPREAIVYVDSMRNLLVLQGSKAQLGGWLELVEAFDVDFLAGMSLGVFVLENASVNVVRDALQALIGGDASAGSPYGNTTSGNAASAAQGGALPAAAANMLGMATANTGASAGAAQATNPLHGLVRVIPVERLNALVVVTPRSHILSQVETWIRRLDRPMDALEATLFVYPVQNGSAIHLAEMLNGLFGSGTSGAKSGVAAGSSPTQFASTTGTATTGPVSAGSGKTATSGGTTMAATGSLPSALQGTANASNAPSTTVNQLDGNVRVVADEKRNALLIRAPRTEYRRIEQALRELDKAPTQVLIEASIVEVSLTGNLAYGVEWFVQNSLGGSREGNALLNLRESGAIGPAQPGFSYTILNKAGTIRATLNALAEKSQLRVLSNPTVLVLDNHNATIQIGNQQPIKSSTSSTGTIVTESITYKDTGVMLSVTPSVNAGGLITMDIMQQVTDVGEIDAATGQRNFLTRQIQSRVAVRSGDPIVLGGMIRENETKGTTGVPLLSDIPVLGALFGKNSDKSARTELLVLLTPRALENDDQLRAASAELRQRMRVISLQPALPGQGKEEATPAAGTDRSQTPAR